MEMITPLEILGFFNEITGHRHRETKSNLSGIKRVLKENYSLQEIREVILLKTMEWKNSPEMAKHLNPVTIFREKNFDKYVNQVLEVKSNPNLYGKYFAKLNKIDREGNPADDLIEMYGD